VFPIGNSTEPEARVTDSTAQIDLPLAALHRELGARLVPFAGHAMPIQYPAGIMAEHLHTRSAAGLFDVSHMGQIVVRGPDPAAALERLIPTDLIGLKPGRQTYGFLTTETGGVADDLMAANRGDHVLLVVNGVPKAADLARLQAGLPDHDATLLEDRALIALQGPSAAVALDAVLPGAAALRFMDVATFSHAGADLWVARSGYTGEDGFEIGLPAAAAESFARALLARPGVLPIGLGARDSLRLEAGMPLYGQDLTPEISPVEAGLGWAIRKVRRTGGARAGGFPGADRILAELDRGPARRRMGLLPQGRAPMRAGTMLYASQDATAPVGTVTSGGFGPSVGAPVAMGYVPFGTSPGVVLYGDVRGRRLPVTVAALPFHQPRYVR
jgi:aminomethyltransferase